MTTEAKIIIAGGSGHIGSFLVNQLCHSYPVCTLDRTSGYDIGNYTSVASLFAGLRPKVVVHCINYGNIRACESNKDEAHKVNVLGTNTVVELCKKYKSYLIYLSTDYVFDGEKGYYTESDAANPINFFGQTKLAAEELIRSAYPDHSLVIRPSAVYGYAGMKKSNFDLWLIERLKRGDEVAVFSDIYSTPTCVVDMAEVLLKCIKLGLTGLYHLSGPQRTSRYELARHIARFLGYDTKLVQPIISDSIESVGRPKDTSLISKALENKLGMAFSSVEEGLRRSSY